MMRCSWSWGINCMKRIFNCCYEFLVGHWIIIFVLDNKEMRWEIVYGKNLLMKGKFIDSCSWSCVKLVVVMIFGMWQL